VPFFKPNWRDDDLKHFDQAWCQTELKNLKQNMANSNDPKVINGGSKSSIDNLLPEKINHNQTHPVPDYSLA